MIVIHYVCLGYFVGLIAAAQVEQHVGNFRGLMKAVVSQSTIKTTSHSSSVTRTTTSSNFATTTTSTFSISSIKKYLSAISLTSAKISSSTSSKAPTTSSSTTSRITTSSSGSKLPTLTTATTTARNTSSTSSVTTSFRSSSTSTLASPSTYAEIVVAHHDYHRANHSAPEIVWDEGLASIARSIAETCVYQHNTTAGGGGYGQNIAAGPDPDSVSYVITQIFYNREVNNFNQYGVANPDFSNFGSWGHFSQIVWKSSSTVGCATVNCAAHTGGLVNTGGNIPPYFTVCNYKPPGNWGGLYAANIGASKGLPSIDASKGIQNYRGWL